MRDLFRTDPERAEKYSIRIDDLLVDFSKHRITDESLGLLLSLADACSIPVKISDLFKGEKINLSEQRSALHAMLRAPAEQELHHDGENITALIHSQLSRMESFVQDLHAGAVHGSTGKSISKVINIGIGGSDLGPRFAVDALDAFRMGGVEIEFVTNLDPKDLSSTLAKSDPETSMFIVSSKSFTTLETRTNADAAREWLAASACNAEDHVIAVTANKVAALEFGVMEENIFLSWEWVGVRYSLWSAVGLPIAIAVGRKNFRLLLAGAHAVNKHFKTEAMDQNVPVILALLNIWYTNFFKAESHAVVPYDQSLRLLPEYLSQLVMESNGKSVSSEGKFIQHKSSAILWGSIGTNAQHAYFQLLHQGTHLVPVDFLIALQNESCPEQHLKLVSNCLAQSEALMMGQENKTEPNKHFEGNTPSTTIVYNSLSPEVLGMLIAIYEHKTFVEAMLWNINPFDQPGVELGKELAHNLSQDLSHEEMEVSGEKHDASTALLIQEYQRRNK